MTDGRAENVFTVRLPASVLRLNIWNQMRSPRPGVRGATTHASYSILRTPLPRQTEPSALKCRGAGVCQHSRSAAALQSAAASADQVDDQDDQRDHQ